MWKPTQTGTIAPSPTPEPSRPAPPAPAFEPPPNRIPVTTGEQATIGKGLFIKGEINGSESLFIDGKVEGSVNLPGNRVTVGRNGQVSANISAREIVVLGKVRGNVSIEDGAYFKGGIDIRKPDAKPGTAAAASGPAPPITETPKPFQA